MKRTHIIHVVHGFSIGGLENIIIQLINRLPSEKFKHTILSLTTISDLKTRINIPDVNFIALNKPPGHAIPLYPRIYKLFRQLRPDVIHTCNLAALEIVPIAWLARVSLRIHAEHGWDAHDTDGTSLRYRQIRKLYKPFVSHYIAVSSELDEYLETAIGIPKARKTLIANGVDTDIFTPPDHAPDIVNGCPFIPRHHYLIGTVGRLQTVKNQPLLARAFIRLLKQHPEVATRMRLIFVGEGPLRQEVEEILANSNSLQYVWLPGNRNDIPKIMQILDCFVLPSRAEGTSCTLQEAMSTGLPVIATAVGGSPVLVKHGITGYLVESDNEDALCNAMWLAYRSPEQMTNYGKTSRELALRIFNIDCMIEKYQNIFQLTC